jgi:hypothetical protein
MKRNASVLLLVMVVAGIIMTGPALGGDSRAELEAIVDDYIAACEAKSAMLNSSSENLRRDAMHACLRATFCRNSKARLIDELVANDVAPKEHTVHHYLNARFNEVVSAKELALK